MMKKRFLAHRITTKELVDLWNQSPFADVTEAQINEKESMINNVCVFGTRYSKNGYTYQDKAIQSLTSMTEGNKFFLNHPSNSESKDRDGVRDVRDWAGVFSSPRQEGDKVFANLKVRPAFWDLLKDVATMQPNGVGCSINSLVKVYKDDDGKEHIVDIDTLKSIDLVASAATTTSLFESELQKIHNEMDEDLDTMVDEILEGDISHMSFVANFVEGLLADKLKEREVARHVNKLTWEASDLIDELIRDSKIKMAEKKKNVIAILDDLEVEINNIINGKSKIDKDEEAFTKEQEEDEMEFGKITLEDILKERPDILEAFKETLEGEKKMKALEEENGTLKTSNEKMTEKLTKIEEEFEAIKKERDELKTKLDEYETKDKKATKEAFIKEKIEEAKLPKEAISNVFMSDLMGKEDKAVEEAIKDRLELWSGSTGKVKNHGTEFTPKGEEKKESVAPNKVESLKAKVKAAARR